MLQENKRYKIIIAALFILGGLLILIGFIGNAADKNRTDTDKKIKKMEERLEEFILNVDGIYEVDVIITLETYKEKDVFYSFGSDDENLQYSRVNGVCVACTNGNSDIVKKEITDIVTSYLGIGTNKVKITGIKK